MLQYPLSAPGSSPFLLFTPIKATFTSGGGTNAMRHIDQSKQLGGNILSKGYVADVVDGFTGKTTPTQIGVTVRSAIRNELVTRLDDGSSPAIALHIPRGIAINDSMNYQNIQSGVMMGVLQTIKSAMDGDDLLGGIQKAFSSADDTTVNAYMARAGTGGEFLAALRRDRIQSDQVILSPREFAMFDAPALRTFSLTFKFIPETPKESDEVSKIISTFRSAMYPDFHDGFETIYKFPKAFKIAYRGIKDKHMIKFPEAVLKDVSVTYNTNSMSYYNYEGQNSPVEIDLQMTFAELVAQSTRDIGDGY